MPSITPATSSASWPCRRAPRRSPGTLTNFLKQTDRFAKTIVFCVDQEHGLQMRRALAELNVDLLREHSDYVCRVTADEGDVGSSHRARFQDVETRTPTILTHVAASHHRRRRAHLQERGAGPYRGLHA